MTRTRWCTFVLMAFVVSFASGPVRNHASSAPTRQRSAANVSYGSLEVHTEPGASILWEGVSLGEADGSGRVSIGDIPLGDYEVELRKEGFETRVEKIDVAGQEVLTAPLVARATSVTSEGAALPDPFARRTSYLGIVLPAAILLVAAAGVFLLLRHRRAIPDVEIPEAIDGPRLAFGRERSSTRRPPQFYEDLRQRESVLERFEERGSSRPAPKVIELPVADRRSKEGEG